MEYCQTDFVMAKSGKQTETGKAFEYALLNEFLERLKVLTFVSVVENEPYKTALKCFVSFDEKEQSHYKLVASFAVNFLLDIEPRLANGINNEDILQLEIVADKAGQTGDGDQKQVLWQSHCHVCATLFVKLLRQWLYLLSLPR